MAALYSPWVGVNRTVKEQPCGNMVRVIGFKCRNPTWQRMFHFVDIMAAAQFTTDQIRSRIAANLPLGMA